MRKAPPKKRVSRSLRPRSNVDPTRMALAALERIKTVLVRSGHGERLGAPLSMKELAAQAELLGTELPPSYVAAMRVASRIGEPERFLTAREMAIEAEAIVEFGGEEAKRYAPFCKGFETVACFDKGGGKRLVSAIRHQGELPIVEWRDGGASPAGAHFGEWLDAVADAREESVETAAKMPQRLKRLLYELGFRFEYPVVGRLETGDAEAIFDLIGPELARTVRGDVDRLFDSSGKASLTLNVDEFTLAVSLRTGIYVFEAEDVFRWLRRFRDENFFSDDAVSIPSHPDQVRDLRRAPSEAPFVERGVLHVAVAPAQSLVFRAASGGTVDDFYLLGRTPSTNRHASSVLLHVVDGAVAAARTIEEPLNDLHVLGDGTIWALTTTHAVRVTGTGAQSFPLARAATGRRSWYGIGGGADRVLVWGAGALLAFDGSEFVPFAPDARLDESESVVGLEVRGLRVWMLVCGDRFGAVARFDSVGWAPITDADVIDAALAHLDVWRGTSYVLDRGGGVWTIDAGDVPRAVPLPARHQAFSTEAGARRPLHEVRAFDGGMLLASIGGVVAVGGGEPLFHAVPGGRDPVRLVRVGGRAATTTSGEARDAAIVALSGANAWIWRPDDGRGGRFGVIDTRQW